MGRGSRPSISRGALPPRPPPLLLLLLLLLPPTQALAPRISLPLGERWGDPAGARAGVGGRGGGQEVPVRRLP